MNRAAHWVAAIATTALATVAIAQTAEDVEFKQSGEFRIRYFNDINTTGVSGAPNHQADSRARLKYNISARKGEKLQAYAGLLHNSIFGSENSADGSYDSLGSQNTLIVNRAWGWWKATDTLSFKVGRFGIELADGAVFSENEWEDVPTAHEGLQLSWDLDFAKLNLFAVKTNEFLAASSVANTITGNPSSDPERAYYMVSADIKNLPEIIKLANFHFIQTNADRRDETSPAATFGSENWQHFGLSVGGEVAGILYKATGALQTGSFNKQDAFEQKLSAHMFDLMVGYSLSDVMGLKISAGYHRDTGNDTGAANVRDENRYQVLYYDRHSYAGLMDVVRCGNLTYYSVNASILPVEDLEVGAGFYMFGRTNASDTISFGDRYGGGGLIPTAGSLASGAFATDQKSIGSEIDIYANKAYEGGFKIGARFGAFLPGDYLKNGTPNRDNTLMQGMLQASMEF